MTTDIYTLSLHYALPISHCNLRTADNLNQLKTSFENCSTTKGSFSIPLVKAVCTGCKLQVPMSTSLAVPLETSSALNTVRDRKSTRLNSSHVRISYAVFC